MGRLNGTSYCQLDRVEVTNLTRNWSETLEYPDTIIVLGSSSDASLNIAATQGLGQNVPNPFDCETRVELSLSQREKVRMQLLDASGRQYADYSGSLDAGMHTFDISAASPQTYILSAVVGDKPYSIRMVNVGNGCGSSIRYSGVSGYITAKLTTANEFHSGDNMRYVGYATIGSTIVTSEVIEQPQSVSQDLTLNFTTSGTVNGHDWVDLGLPSGLLWATCNVGSTTPEGYGDYFAWGETTTKETYTADNYTYSDNPTTLPPSADAATVNWGAGWRMPTQTEMNELLSNCTYEWTTQNGVNGCLFTGPNGNSIFLPAAGYHYGSDLNNVGSYARYWSCLPDASITSFAWGLYFSSGTCGVHSYGRFFGFSVRPVIPPATVTVTFDANGGTGTMAPQTFTTGVAQALTANSFTRTDYVFSGWNTSADGSGTSYSDGQSISISANMTLYAQWNGTVNGHEYVDLGLPSGRLWATCNVGATSPEGYGDFFAWGETSTKTTYNWSTYQYCNGSGTTLTKYCNNTVYGNNGYTDNLTTLEASDDAATANWGSGWRMPTYDELNELKSNCTVTWTTRNGVNGRLFTGPNGNSIFLPAAGHRYDSSSDGTTYYGRYWSSSLYTENAGRASYLYFSLYSYDTGDRERYYGMPVRPVVLPATVTVTFNANGGTGTMAPQTFTTGVAQALTVNSFTRTDYFFSGWNTSADGSGTSYSNGQSISISANMTLYAQWTPADYVDLGLPSGLLWATCNVGSTTPEGYGDYFAWGETTTKETYSEDNYTYSDNPTTLPPSADAATANWGTGWRMPTKEEMNELENNCTVTWTTRNGVNGRLFTGPNGNSIFLPAAGYRWNSSLYDNGSYGYYWSSSLYTGNPRALHFSSDNCYVAGYDRSYGFSVRPVCAQ